MESYPVEKSNSEKTFSKYKSEHKDGTFADFFGEYIAQSEIPQNRISLLIEPVLKNNNINLWLDVAHWSRLFDDLLMEEVKTNCNLYMKAINQGYFVAYACDRIVSLRNKILNENGTLKKEIFEKIAEYIRKKYSKSWGVTLEKILQKSKDAFCDPMSETEKRMANQLAEQILEGIKCQVALEFSFAHTNQYIPYDLLYLVGGFDKTKDFYSSDPDCKNYYFKSDLAVDEKLDHENLFYIRSFPDIPILNWSEIQNFAKDINKIKDFSEVQFYIQKIQKIKIDDPNYLSDSYIAGLFKVLENNLMELVNQKRATYLALEDQKKEMIHHLDNEIQNIKTKIQTLKQESDIASSESRLFKGANQNKIKEQDAKLNLYTQLKNQISEIFIVTPQRTTYAIERRLAEERLEARNSSKKMVLK